MELEKLRYEVLNEPNAEVRKLLSETIYGTKGGLQLRHCDTSWKLDELLSPDYHVLYDGETLVGVVVYSNRRSLFGEKELNTLYIRYFSISPNYQNRGVAKYLTEIAVKNYRKSLKEPTVVYAFIEAKNTRSMAVGEFFEPMSLGYFSPIYFSRFYPKCNANIKESIEGFETKYPMKYAVNFNYAGRSEKNAKYFSLENGNDFAAIRCYPVKWEVIQYPNNNWLMKKFLPSIPVLNKLVEGSELNFVAIDGISWNSNDLLVELFEHALGKMGMSKLMVFADVKDQRFVELRKDKRLGLMSKLQKAPKVGIQLFFHECDDSIKEMIKQYPVEVKGFDVT